MLKSFLLKIYYWMCKIDFSQLSLLCTTSWGLLQQICPCFDILNYLRQTAFRISTVGYWTHFGPLCTHSISRGQTLISDVITDTVRCIAPQYIVQCQWCNTRQAVGATGSKFPTVVGLQHAFIHPSLSRISVPALGWAFVAPRGQDAAPLRRSVPV